MSRKLGFWSILLLFALSSILQASILVAACVGLGLFIAVFCRISPHVLFLMSIPFVITIDTPVRLTLTISDFILPVVVLALLWRLWGSDRAQVSLYIRLMLPAAVWATALIIAITLSSIQAELDFSDFLVASAKLFYAIIGGFAIVGIYLAHRDDSKVLDELLRSFVFTSAAVAAVGIVAFALFLVFNIDSALIYGSTRLQSTFDNPNAFASYGLISLPIALYYAHRTAGRYASTLGFLILVGVILSNSRTGQLATISLLILGFVLLVRTRRQLVSWSKFALPGLALAGGLLPLLSGLSSILSSVQDAGTADAGSNGACWPGDDDARSCRGEEDEPLAVRSGLAGDVRFALWEIAFKVWLGAPIFGRGYGQFLSASADYRNDEILLRVHNTFLSFLAEVGIVGALVFVIPFVLLPVLLLKLRSSLGNSLTLSMLTVCVMMLALNLENSRSLWVLVGMSYALVVAGGPSFSRVVGPSRPSIDTSGGKSQR